MHTWIKLNSSCGGAGMCTRVGTVRIYCTVATVNLRMYMYVIHPGPKMSELLHHTTLPHPPTHS